MKTKTLRQKVVFASDPHKVYELLMDAKQHARFTGGKAAISRNVGGKFSVFDGYATGKNIELIQDKKIVQTWRASDWEEGHYSTVEFTFSPVKRGTALTFVQKEIPSEQYASIKRGWHDFYWKPMKGMLENR
ncbi:MAG: SRPBCC family protein [Bacteroidota bacterium]